MAKESTLRDMTESQLRAVVREESQRGFQDGLVSIGLDPDDPIEIQKDLHHLRSWRTSMDAVKSKGVLTIVAFFVTGIAGAVWLGIQKIVIKS